MALDVTAFILTQNNIRTIRKCIDSVLWCDEIVVIDSFSDDGTIDLLQSYRQIRLYQHQYTNAREQRIWGMPHVLTKWVFIIDSDEFCPDKLRDKIIEVLRTETGLYDGYLIRTRTIFMGRLLSHKDYLSSYGKRLVLTKVATRYWREVNVHASIRLDNKKYIDRIYYLVHDPIQSLRQHIDKMCKYANWQAEDMYASGKKVRFWHLTFRPMGKFLKHYVFYLGFLDGFQGLIICMLGGWSVFLKFMYLKEKKHNDKS